MEGERDTRAHQRVGTVLNEKWTLEELIGMGGMAAVYAARHRNGARAAVKVIHPDIGRIPEIRQRFLREGYAANRVDHVGAVRVQDDDVVVGGPDEGAAFLVMELLDGVSLEERIQQGPKIEERELLLVLRAILDVLEVAHAAGVIHRDLKPENLFILRPLEGGDPAKPKVKVLDFGLARISEGSRTIAGLAIGTPSYMPPEQAAGRVLEIDHRADLFALGATGFRILAGRTVHPASNPMEIVLRMAREPAPPLRSIAPRVSVDTAKVIDRALAFAKEARFPDAASMRVAVDEAIASLHHVIELSLSEADVVIPSLRSVPPPAAEMAAFVARPTVLATAPARPARDLGRDEARDEGLDSILQRLDLAPRPLRKRWRIFAAASLAWGAIGFGVLVDGETPPVDARLPLVSPPSTIAATSTSTKPSATPSARFAGTAKATPHAAPSATTKTTHPH